MTTSVQTGGSQTISVAEAKRRFSDVLGAVRYQNERFVIERNGTPMAALVPLSDLDQRWPSQQGFLALVGAFADTDDLTDALDEAVDSRAEQESRPAPEFGE